MHALWITAYLKLIVIVVPKVPRALLDARSHHRSLDSYIAVRLGTLYVVTRSAIPASGIGDGGSMAFMPQAARLALFQLRAAPPTNRTS